MSDQRIIVSYLELRRIIGLIGICHPPILFIGGLWIYGLSLQGSMSSYYYTGMRDIFVGFGFVTGVFLLCYRGYDIKDRITSSIAGAAALVVSLFPTAPDPATAHQVFIAKFHGLAALVFLACIAYFSLVLFPRTGENDEVLSWEKKTRNTIYRACGIIILVCMCFVLVYMYSTAMQAALKPYRPIFFVEALSFISFGLAWLVKGQGLFPDKQ